MEIVGASRPARRLLPLLSAFLFLSAFVMASMGPAQADPARVAGTAHSVTFMGINKLGSTKFICIGNGYYWPTKLGSAKTATNAKLAFLIHKYGSTTNKANATALA